MFRDTSVLALSVFESLILKCNPFCPKEFDSSLFSIKVRRQVNSGAAMRSVLKRPRRFHQPLLDTHVPLILYRPHRTGFCNLCRHTAARSRHSVGASPDRARGRLYTHNTPADYLFQVPCFTTVSEKQNRINPSLAVSKLGSLRRHDS